MGRICCAAVLDPDEKAFVAYVASLTYRKCRFIWPDFTITSPPDSAKELPELTGTNDHAINLVEDKKIIYDPIHSLESVELENSEDLQDLANGLIRPSKSPTGVSTLFC